MQVKRQTACAAPGSSCAHAARWGVNKIIATRWAAGTDYEVQRVSAHQDDSTIIFLAP